jgi:hypothetical protein
VRTIAERLICGLPAAAKSDCGSAGQVELFSLSILNDEISRNSKRSIWKYIDFGRIGHALFLLRSILIPEAMRCEEFQTFDMY